MWPIFLKVYLYVLLGPYVFLSYHMPMYLLSLHPDFGGWYCKVLLHISKLNLVRNIALLGILGFTISLPYKGYNS